MQRWTPQEIVAILNSANTSARDAQLDRVLDAFIGQWRKSAQQRYRMSPQDLEDAVQDAAIKMLRPEALDQLCDPGKVESWARSIFIHVVMDGFRHGRREREGRTSFRVGEDDQETSVLDHIPAEQLTPEEIAMYRQRLQMIADRVEESRVLILKFVHERPEQEIARRLETTRDAVAGQVRRFRDWARRVDQE